MSVAIKLDGLTDGGVLDRLLEERKLDVLARIVAHSTIRCRDMIFSDSIDDGTRIDALVDVERDGRDFKGGVFGLASPD
jgi:hypothetical protein